AGWTGCRNRSRELVTAAGVRMACQGRRHYRSRNASHLQLRHRTHRYCFGEIRGPRHRRVSGERRSRHAARRTHSRRWRAEGTLHRHTQILMTRRIRTAVLISGRGSNLQALIEATRASEYPADIVLVISNVEIAEGLQRARDAGVPIKVISHKTFASREEFDVVIDAALRGANVSLVCEAGFMRIHSEWFVKRWEGRLLNIHPSLLPSFPGIRVHQQALRAGVKISGCTVHFIVHELDS